MIPAAVPSAAAIVPRETAIRVENSVPVEHHETRGAKITKVTILTNQNKFSQLQEALDTLGITGLTVTNVFGYGAQKGHPLYFRGNPIASRLLPKVKIDIVICKVPVETLVKTVQETLYTGHYGDGKLFIYDVEDVIKIRTGERGYDALQDEETEDSLTLFSRRDSPSLSSESAAISQNPTYVRSRLSKNKPWNAG